MSLTHIHRCGTVFGKECKNSVHSGTRIRKPCGFFTPARFYVGRAAAIQDPQGESCPPSMSGFLPSRHPQVRRVRTSLLCSSNDIGDVFMTQLPAAVCFSGKSLSIIDRDGTPYLSARELARALGYADERSVLRIYARRTDEFTEQMTCVVKLTPQGEQARDIRIFSPRGCHLVAMFARTSVAAAFRRWV
ncbi:BRO-N domain-containing protein, partial [Xylella fastidiosa]